jgi:hypothetical protein
MCHCECSVKSHVKIYKHSVRNLVKIWNALSLSILCNWQVSLAYSMLNYIFMNSNFWIWIFFIAFVWLYTIYSKLYTVYNILYSILYIVYNILYSILYIVYNILYSILYIVYNILYIVYWIQIQCISIVFLFNSNVYSNTLNKLLEPTLHLYILNPPFPWQCLWDK